MIRKATLQDIEAIVALIKPHSDAGILLPRTPDEVEAHLREFIVSEQEGKLTGTASLVTGYNRMVEIRSLVVDPAFQKNGIGQALVQSCIDEAIEMGYESIFVLTYVSPVFKKLGFKIIDKSELPDKIWKDCHICIKQNHCDEIAMRRELVRVTVDGLPEALTSGDSDPIIQI